jgi:hypothetical protein
MDMYVYNQSDGELKSYNITHSWDDITDNLHGENLPKGEYSQPQQVTTGYGPEYDWYTVQVTFANGAVKGVHFYCNSSHSNSRVELEIETEYLNCVYYDPGHKLDSACNKKHWD